MEKQVSSSSAANSETANGTVKLEPLTLPMVHSGEMSVSTGTSVIAQNLQANTTPRPTSGANLTPGVTNSAPAISSDEKPQDGYENINKKPKGKKRKKTPRDVTAPRQPLTGYVRYLNERREKARSENPTMSFSDLTRLMACEWGQMPASQKQQYLDAAEADKERYFTEMNAYRQTEAYKIFTQKQTEKKKPHIKVPPIGDIDLEREPYVPSMEIPVFTEEFLDMNKTREMELRNLRKSNIDLEHQNAVLQKHIEDMKVAVDKLEAETAQAHNNNQTLGSHLQLLRTTIASSFGQFPLPGEKEGPTVANVDAYMSRLDTLLQDSSTPNRDALGNKVRELVSRMELHG